MRYFFLLFLVMAYGSGIDIDETNSVLNEIDYNLWKDIDWIEFTNSYFCGSYYETGKVYCNLGYFSYGRRTKITIYQVSYMDRETLKNILIHEINHYWQYRDYGYVWEV